METMKYKSLSEIGNLSKLAAELIKNNKLHKALHTYDQAYQLSKVVKDPKTERTCTFNLGAVYIALRYAEKGLELLKLSEPPNDSSEKDTCGDLYFNFGLAYECLENPAEAIKYYDLCRECVEKIDDFSLHADACVKLGYVYSQLYKHRQAAESYELAARSYETIENTQRQVFSKCEQAYHLSRDFKTEATLLAEECLEMCSKIHEGTFMEFIYNDLGLIFIVCRQFEKAETCFSLGLPASRRPGGDEKQEAVLIQNLGAIYNFLGDYHRSISLHEEAVKKYAKLKNRLCQGQCFSNLAFAYCQLGMLDNAALSFQHALQAARDTDDYHSQWQILEGLGCVAYNQSKHDTAVKLFKMALSVLSQSGEKVGGAQDRIVAQLTKVLEFKIKEDAGSGQMPLTLIGGPNQILNASIRQQQYSSIRNESKPMYSIPLTQNSITAPLRKEDSVLVNGSAPATTHTEHVQMSKRPDITSQYEEHLRKKEQGELHQAGEEESESEEESEEEEESEDEEEKSEDYETGEEENETETESESEQQPETTHRLSGNKTTQHVQSSGATQSSTAESGHNTYHVLSPVTVQSNSVQSHRQQSRPIFMRGASDEETLVLQPAWSLTRKISFEDEKKEVLTKPDQLIKQTNAIVVHAGPETVKRVTETTITTTTRRQTIEEDKSEIEEEWSDTWSHEEEDEDTDTDRESPSLPAHSPPRTLNGTYETPMLKPGVSSELLLNTEGRLSPTYAEIDFTKSGRPIIPSGSGKSAEDPPVTNPGNHFHSGDEADNTESKIEETIHEEEEEENLYESIHPREELSKAEHTEWGSLPRGERERLMFEEHKKTIAAEQNSDSGSEKLGRSKTCVVM